MHPGFLRASAVFSAIAALLCPAAGWAEVRTVVLRGAGQCPTADDVARQVRKLLPGMVVRPGIASSADELGVEVFEDGARYGVIVQGRTQTFTDARRRCGDRASAAALVIAIAVAPPSVEPPPPEPRLPTPSPREPPPREPPPREPPPREPPPREPGQARTRFFALEVGAVVDAALGVERGADGQNPQGQSDTWSVGGALRLAIGVPWLQGVVSVAALSPLSLDFNGGRIRLWRLPLELGGRIGGSVGPVQMWGHVGLSATILSGGGTDLAVNRSQLRAELGVRAGLTIRLPLGDRWGAVLTLDATFLPDPIVLTAVPVGTLGHVPRWHLGGLVGASYRFD